MKTPMQSETTTYRVRRNIHGHAEAVERDGYTVLILVCGAERNEQEVDRVVEKLNNGAK